MKINESIIYSYTGKSKKITLNPGYYFIECYGAKGGGSTGANGNKASGYLKIGKVTDLFLHIGQQATSAIGGWNGGASVTEPGVYGGGKDYIYTKMYDTTIDKYVNSGNGLIKITKVPERLNSNYYKDSCYQETFDFNKLLEV